MPTQLERTGDFSQAQTTAGIVPIIYDPFSNPRTPFPGNIITSIDPAAKGLLNYIPSPNLPGSVQNFHLQESLPTANDRIMGRIGHQISAKDSLNAMYYFNSSRSQSVSTFPALTSTNSVRGQNMSLAEIHTLGPRTVNTLTANFNRQRTSLLDPFAYKQDIDGDLGIRVRVLRQIPWTGACLPFSLRTSEH